MKYIIVVLTTLSLLTIIGSAEAKTVNFSDVYKDVYLYGSERLKVFNDLPGPHSITSTNRTGDNSFSTGTLYHGGLADMGFYTDGDYQFYDENNPSNTGTIHVITNGIAPAELKTTRDQVEAGDSFEIRGDYFKDNTVNIIITKPDGTTYQDLTVSPTKEGVIDVPIQTSRNDENGVYTITIPGKPESQSGFVINGGVTADNPLVIAPVTNSTQNNSTDNTPALEQSGSSGGSISTKPNQSVSFTDTEKLALINYFASEIKSMQERINTLQLLIQILNGTQS